MKGKWASVAVLMAAAIALLSQPSCAHNQHLVAITVSPQGETITLSELGQDVTTQFTATGIYIHPPENRDLTKTAIWATDSPSIITLDPNTPGLVHTTGEGCGTNLGVTATVYTDNGNPSGNVVVGSSTMNVSFVTTNLCP